MMELIAGLRLLGSGWRIFVFTAVVSLIASIAEMTMMAILVPFLSILLGTHDASASQVSFGSWLNVPFPDFVGPSGRGKFAFLTVVFVVLLSFRVGAEYIGMASITARVQRAVADLRIKLFERFVSYGKTFYDDVG